MPKESNNSNPQIENIKKSIEDLIKVPITVKRQKKSFNDEQKALFHIALNNMMLIDQRSKILHQDFEINLTQYNESFYRATDSLLELHFGKMKADIIMFYLYERLNDDGTINPLMTSEGTPVILENTDQLWSFLSMIKDASS